MVKFTTISYGIAIIVISAMIYYIIQPGIHNCNSMAGIVSGYISKDYAIGCQNLSYLQLGSMTSGIVGMGLVIFGLFTRRRKNDHLFGPDAYEN
jgi:hypothetical protein